MLIGLVAHVIHILARGGGGSGGGGHSGGGGGGGHSSSSSSSGFGSGGGHSGFFFIPFGGGGGGAAGFLLLLILVPIILAIVFVVLRRRRRGHDAGATEQFADAMRIAKEDPSVGIAAIAANDPGFNVEAFIDRAQAAFFLLQQAWQDRNVDEGRAYMSPGLYTSWKSQVDSMASQHRRDVMEGLTVEGIHLVKAEHDDNFDNVSVLINAKAKDYIVDEQTGKQVSGDHQVSEFAEYWTFTRSEGAKTLVGGGVTEKKCPNCGAPLSVNATGACSYCNTVITSGTFDWVLTRIDQPSEWTG